MQLVALRQTSPLNFFFTEPIRFYLLFTSIAFVLLSSSSPKMLMVSYELKNPPVLSVKELMIFLMGLMGLSRLRKPTQAYSILLMQAQGVLIFSTVYVTLASTPIPTQLVNALVRAPSFLSTDFLSFTSKILPPLKVYILTSHISYLQILAPIQLCTCRAKLSMLKWKGQTGHPIDLQKSLPVPIGITPNRHLPKLTSCFINSLITQLIVPSPPQIIILTGESSSLRTDFKSSTEVSLLLLSNRSTKRRRI